MITIVKTTVFQNDRADIFNDFCTDYANPTEYELQQMQNSQYLFWSNGNEEKRKTLDNKIKTWLKNNHIQHFISEPNLITSRYLEYDVTFFLYTEDDIAITKLTWQ